MRKIKSTEEITYIAERRQSRFDAFRATLSEEDQKALDRKFDRWCLVINNNRGRGGFGKLAAQELFMALAEFCCEHQLN